MCQSSSHPIPRCCGCKRKWTKISVGEKKKKRERNKKMRSNVKRLTVCVRTHHGNITHDWSWTHKLNFSRSASYCHPRLKHKRRRREKKRNRWERRERGASWLDRGSWPWQNNNTVIVLFILSLLFFSLSPVLSLSLTFLFGSPRLIQHLFRDFNGYQNLFSFYYYTFFVFFVIMRTMKGGRKELTSRWPNPTFKGNRRTCRHFIF